MYKFIGQSTVFTIETVSKTGVVEQPKVTLSQTVVHGVIVSIMINLGLRFSMFPL